MTTTAPAARRRGIPGFAQMQRLGKSLMLPIAVLPAAGILLRLGQPDLLGQIDLPVIGPFFQAMSAAGGALFDNLALLFAVGVAIGFAKKADGSTALSAVVGYLVLANVFTAMSPVVLAGQTTAAGDQVQINYSVFGGIVIGLLTAWLFDRYHTIQLPSYLGFFGGRRFVPIVVSLASLVVGFGLSYFYPIFNTGLTGLGAFIGGTGALGAFVYGFTNRMLIPVGLHHILNSYVWFLQGSYTKGDGSVVTGELTRFAAGDPRGGRTHLRLLPRADVRPARRRARDDPPRQPRPAQGGHRHPRPRGSRLPHGCHRTARVRLHVRRVPALRRSRGAHRHLARRGLPSRHPPGLLLLGGAVRPAAVRHRARGEQRVAAGGHGRGVLRRLLPAVPSRHQEVEPAHPGP